MGCSEGLPRVREPHFGPGRVQASSNRRGPGLHREQLCCDQHFPGGEYGHEGAVVVKKDHVGDVGEGTPGTHSIPACAGALSFPL